MIETEKRITNESFGVLKISKVTSSNKIALFGSSIKHQHFISLIVCPAMLNRSLNRDWISDAGRIPYIEVLMSYNQFAEAITSFNQGSGTPVTIERIAGRKIPEFELIDKPEEFKLELADTISGILKEIEDFKKELLQTNLAIKVRKNLLKQFDRIKMQLQENVPFIEKQFQEQMEKTITEAKSEFEGFVEGRVRDLGLEKMKVDKLLSIEDKKHESGVSNGN